MENTNYVARAKALMKSHARSAALVIVPLASAVSAHAIPVSPTGIVLPSNNLTCTSTPLGGSGSNCNSGAGVFAVGGGLDFFTTSSGSFAFSSGGQISMTTQGAVSGAILAGATIPYTYDFSLDAGSDPAWHLEFGILDVTTDTVILDQTISGSFGPGFAVFTGSGAFTALASTSPGDVLKVGFILGEAGQGEVQVNIPGATSIDFGAISSAPEPASMGLLGSGLAWLAYRWRKRRKNPLPPG